MFWLDSYPVLVFIPCSKILEYIISFCINHILVKIKLLNSKILTCFNFFDTDAVSLGSDPVYFFRFWNQIPFNLLNGSGSFFFLEGRSFLSGSTNQEKRINEDDHYILFHSLLLPQE